MRVFRNRARSGRHDRHTEVATNGTRIITTNNGHGHRGTTVVAVPATHVSSGHGHRGTTTVLAANVSSGHDHRAHVTSSHDHRRYYHDNPSTIHGLWNKFLGALTGNHRRRRHGEREMRKAHERREALRISRGVQRVHEMGHMKKLRKFRERHRRRRRDHQDPVVIAHDSGRRQGRTPWLHHKHRTLPPYHGMHHSIMGFFTRRQERRALGKAMAAAAEEERRRERRRRREEMRDMGRHYRERARR